MSNSLKKYLSICLVVFSFVFIGGVQVASAADNNMLAQLASLKAILQELLTKVQGGQLAAVSAYGSFPVTGPAAGTAYTHGNNITVTWDPSGVSGYVYLKLYRQTDGREMSSSWVPNSGSYTFSAGPTMNGMSFVGQFKAGIFNNASGAFTEASGQYFTVSAPSAAPALKVSSPNGGETVNVGNYFFVNWNKDALPNASTVTLQIVNSAGGAIFSNSSVPNSGSYWMRLAVSGQFKAKVSSGSVSDESDGFFTSVDTSSAAAPTCTINTDKDTYNLGESVVISYTSQGATYATYKSNYPKEDLVTPGDKLETARKDMYPAKVVGNPVIKLAVYNQAGVEGTCSKTISVVLPLKVSSPNGGEIYQKYTNFSVVWNKEAIEPLPNGNTVNLKFYNSISSSEQSVPNTGTFTSQLPAGQWKVKVSSLDGSVSDESDGFFTVAESAPVAAGSYTVSQNNSLIYSLRAVRAGAEVALAGFKFTNTGNEPVNIRRIAMQASPSGAYKILNGQQISIWDGSIRVGTLNFVNIDKAVATLDTPINIPSGTHEIIIKGTLIESDVSGRRLAINYDGTNNGLSGNYGSGVNSGVTILPNSATTNTQGVIIYKNIPTFEIVSNGGLFMNNVDTYKVKVTNPAATDIALSQLTFSVMATGGTPSGFTLYADGIPVSAPVNPSNNTVKIAFDTNSPTKIIPAGSSRTYTLRCASLSDVANISETLSIALKADFSFSGAGTAVGLKPANNIVWSPRTSTTLSANDSSYENVSDWFNGFGLPGFPAGGGQDFPMQTWTRGGSEEPTPVAACARAGEYVGESPASLPKKCCPGLVPDQLNPSLALGYKCIKSTPNITDVSAKAANKFEMAAGDSAYISGTNLGGNVEVYIDGIKSEVRQASDTLIIAIVPLSLRDGFSYGVWVQNEKGKSDVVQVKVVRGGISCKAEGEFWNPALSPIGTACCAGLTAETQPLLPGTSGRPYVKCVKSPQALSCKSSSGKSMTLDEARSIAKTGDCAKLKLTGIDDCRTNNNGIWWLGAEMDSCFRACIINVDSKSSEAWAGCFGGLSADSNENVVSDFSVPCTQLTYDLRFGARDSGTGGQVTKLQEYLSSAGYLDVEPTGYFGALTTQAVKIFQGKNGIPSMTGGVGQLTRNKIKEVSCK
ncbi:MAG TPA: peptidoglycan-binding domain-containing protein [Candidatus Paceibacterota bacterium]|nr:peptidoglycan-binding domain-containing protein [Candidatus Paceibacterota bacterium]